MHSRQQGNEMCTKSHFFAACFKCRPLTGEAAPLEGRSHGMPGAVGPPLRPAGRRRWGAKGAERGASGKGIHRRP